MTIKYQINLELPQKSPPSTRHYKDGTLLPVPASLVICEARFGWYLLYLDKDGEEQTDTFHDSLDAAFEQAQFEFGVTPSMWRPVE